MISNRHFKPYNRITTPCIQIITKFWDCTGRKDSLKYCCITWNNFNWKWRSLSGARVQTAELTVQKKREILINGSEFALLQMHMRMKVDETWEWLFLLLQLQRELPRSLRWILLYVSLNKFTIPMWTNHLTLSCTAWYMVDSLSCMQREKERCCMLECVHKTQKQSREVEKEWSSYTCQTSPTVPLTLTEILLFIASASQRHTLRRCRREIVSLLP